MCYNLCTTVCFNSYSVAGLNVTLLTVHLLFVLQQPCLHSFYLRMLKAWHYPHLLLSAVLRPRAAEAPAVQAAIDRYLLAAGPAAANPPHAVAAGEQNRHTDRRADRRTPYRFIDPAVRTVPINE